MRKKIIAFITILFFIFPNLCLADGELHLQQEYPVIHGITISNVGEAIGKVIAYFYYFIVSISGLCALLMLVWGGFEWLTSAGDVARLSAAKETISSAIFGLIIVLSSYLLIKIVNPDLLSL